MNANNVPYWEDYYGQDVTGFTDLSYEKRDGTRVFVPIDDDIEAQVAEIKRLHGSKTFIRVHQPAPVG